MRGRAAPPYLRIYRVPHPRDIHKESSLQRNTAQRINTFQRFFQSTVDRKFYPSKQGQMDRSQGDVEEVVACTKLMLQEKEDH